MGNEPFSGKRIYFCRKKEVQILTPGIKLYRKLRYRKGYGVHSPFVYNLITNVIEEKTPYYAFEEIENERKRILSFQNNISKITAKETQSPNYGALLFRLVNFFKCRNVIEIGSTTGIMSLYLSMASRNSCSCFALEERPNIIDTVEDFAKKHHLSRLHLIQGDYESNLKELHSTLQKADLIFINRISDVEKVVSLCAPFMHNETVLVLNDITKNKEMKGLWKKIKKDNESRITIDLYSLGLVFLDEKFHKQHYKNHFDHGKKQNLHKNRRRRLNLISRRKKSFKNKFSH